MAKLYLNKDKAISIDANGNTYIDVNMWSFFKLHLVLLLMMSGGLIVLSMFFAVLGFILNLS